MRDSYLGILSDRLDPMFLQPGIQIPSLVENLPANANIGRSDPKGTPTDERPMAHAEIICCLQGGTEKSWRLSVHPYSKSVP